MLESVKRESLFVTGLGSLPSFDVSRFTFHVSRDAHRGGFMTVPLSYYLVLSGIVFLTGVVGVLLRRNIIIILLSIELMLNATNINFVAFSQYLHDITGQVFVFFALTVAAAEVAVGLAIIIALYRAKSTINIDELQLLKW
jgi:NADH-quinone oxidoreductase subunit K